MSEDKKTPYCLMPWIHLHIGDNGMAKACCVANIPFGNINEKNLEEIWKGDAINQIREKFSKGESDKRCAKCIHVEQAGGKSMRLETFEKYGDLKPIENILPYYFDIRFSNVCNFRCRTCWHGASSKWFQDAKALGRHVGEKAIIKNIKDFDAFISKTGTALKQAKEIYIAGGEPMVTEEHYLLLEWLIKNGNTDLLLRYNTNFSKLTFKQWDVLQLWEQFSNVEIMASIDGIGELGEYIRKEMDWEKILINREHIRRLKNIQFKVSPTVSVFNMEYLPEMYKEMVSTNFIRPKDIYLNLLERPNYYNIQIFSKEQKAAIQKSYAVFFEWLSKNGIDSFVKDQFQVCLDYMEEKDDSRLWSKFLNETEKLDEVQK